MKDHVVIDVRSAEELEHAPIIGALHIPLADLMTRRNEISRDKLAAFVCSGNVRSLAAAKMLHSLGFENVCVLDRSSFTDRVV